MTVTSRAVRRFDRSERLVYQAAVRLAEQYPAGFDAPQLADSLGCSRDEALRWLTWLRATGDFEPAEPATH